MLENVPLDLKIDMLSYSLCCLISLVLIVKNRKIFHFLTKDYFSFIFTWKRFLIYLVGTSLLVLPVPLLDYSAWDYPIAIFQPILAYLSAPWAIAVFTKREKGRATKSETFTAVCMMLFTGSWAVEIYILIRDGYYMEDWLYNIPIGIVCYLLVGLLWNLESDNDKPNPVLEESS